MKLYVLETGYDHDSVDLIGIFDSLEKAKEMLKEVKKTIHFCDMDWWEITELKMNICKFEQFQVLLHEKKKK